MTLPTPSVLVDYDRLLSNIRLVQSKADAAGIAVRPHIKTHKSLRIAALQIEEGAIGVTASKVDEALVFISAGIGSVTVAYPLIDSRKLDRLLPAAKAHATDLRLIADSFAGVEAISDAALRYDMKVDLILKIDVGLHRCGVRENDPDLLALVRKIHSSPMLRFLGLLSHAGHAYAAKNMDEVRAIAEEEVGILKRVRSQIESAGISVREVSVGSTPTVLASNNFDAITEIRPGNYVFLDGTQIRLGVARASQVALSVLATVISANRDYLIIDAGSKVLSSDLGPHGTVSAAGYGMAYPVESYEAQQDGLQIVKLSEEHGFVQRGESKLKIGSIVRIIPNHACPIINLAHEFFVEKEGEPMMRWNVDARGCVQ